MTTLQSGNNRRIKFRRKTDCITEDLYKTFSTPHCHSCLERTGGTILLLNHERCFLYATAKMCTVINSPNKLFTLTPKFSLLASQHTSKVETFFNEKNNQKKPLTMQLKNEKNLTILITCFHLPEVPTPDLQTARFLIKLQEVDQYSIEQWHFFAEQFTLTKAEMRLCQDLMSGLTLNHYSNNWNVTISTARSQLSSVFTKTSTHRQADLLRLINLLLRT